MEKRITHFAGGFGGSTPERPWPRPGDMAEVQRNLEKGKTEKVDANLRLSANGKEFIGRIQGVIRARMDATAARTAPERQRIASAQALRQGSKPTPERAPQGARRVGNAPETVPLPRVELSPVDAKEKPGAQAKNPEKKPENPEAKADAPEKKPETHLDRIAQEWSKVEKEMEAAKLEGNKDKQMVATLKALALVIEAISRAFNGTLLSSLDAKASDVKTKPSEGALTPEEARKAVLEDIRKEDPKPKSPEQWAVAAEKVGKTSQEKIDKDKKEIPVLEEKVRSGEAKHKELAEQKGKLEGQAKTENDPQKRQELSAQIGEIAKQLDALKNDIDADKKKLAELQNGVKQLESKSEAAKKFADDCRKATPMFDWLAKELPDVFGVVLAKEGGLRYNPDANALEIHLASAQDREALQKKLGGGTFGEAFSLQLPLGFVRNLIEKGPKKPEEKESAEKKPEKKETTESKPEKKTEGKKPEEKKTEGKSGGGEGSGETSGEKKT